MTTPENSAIRVAPYHDINGRESMADLNEYGKTGTPMWLRQCDGHADAYETVNFEDD